MSDSTTMHLKPRENGPRGMSNGGFACGSFAGVVGGTGRVRLHDRVPVDVPLSVADGTPITVSHGAKLLATVEATAAFTLDPPVRPTMAEAERARHGHPLRGVRHPLSNCVVCGPERHDGLRVTPGPLADHPEVLASPFVPTAAYAVDGIVRPAAVWGALDCPSYPAAALRTRRFCLLGSMRAHQVRPISVGEELVVVGWTTRQGSRSVHTASAIIDRTGTVVASADAVWVALRHQWLIRTMSWLRS
ncbi:hypothetical protein [Nocardia lasii]|uniref:Thioesterase family protein n=1 Tax=Nocardia lasii TaxID=1616107 RepID=A0ABW1JNN8_9NOCA